MEKDKPKKPESWWRCVETDKKLRRIKKKVLVSSCSFDFLEEGIKKALDTLQRNRRCSDVALVVPDGEGRLRLILYLTSPTSSSVEAAGFLCFHNYYHITQMIFQLMESPLIVTSLKTEVLKDMIFLNQKTWKNVGLPERILLFLRISNLVALSDEDGVLGLTLIPLVHSFLFGFTGIEIERDFLQSYAMYIAEEAQRQEVDLFVSMDPFYDFINEEKDYKFF